MTKSSYRALIILGIGLAVAFWLFRPVPLHEAVNLRDVTGETFAAEVLESEGLVLVDFWAPWCVWCRRVMPTLDKLAGDYADRVKFVKVNVDEHPDIAERYRVEGLPNVFLFRDGVALDTRLGAQSEQAYRDWIDEHLAGGT